MKIEYVIKGESYFYLEEVVKVLDIIKTLGFCKVENKKGDVKIIHCSNLECE